MNRVVAYLESKDVVFHCALALVLLYVPHAGHLFKQLEHIDMTVYGFTFLNWTYGIALAAVIEVLILVFIINGHQTTGKVYALVSFCINAMYYDYWFLTVQEPTLVNIKLTVMSCLICFLHSLAIWQLSDLFSRRIKLDKERVIEHWCSQCDSGPFPNKRSLDGHISKAHKYIKRESKTSRQEE